MKDLWLIAGLGNPGLRYRNTWHNLGFMAADQFASNHGLAIKKNRFQAKTAEASILGKTVLLLKPQTFMNLSGNSILAAATFYHVPPERILVICDDLDLALGQIRLRGKGSAGSHNGLKSIERVIGQHYARLRIGMGPRPDGDLRDVVLDRIPKQAEPVVDEVLKRAVDCMAIWLGEGLEAAQQVHNQK